MPTTIDHLLHRDNIRLKRQTHLDEVTAAPVKSGDLVRTYRVSTARPPIPVPATGASLSTIRRYRAKLKEMNWTDETESVGTVAEVRKHGATIIFLSCMGRVCRPVFRLWRDIVKVDK